MTAQQPIDENEFACTYLAGESVFEEGQDGNEMFIIQVGQIEILMAADGEQHRLALLEEGDFFGEMAILEDVPRTATAKAVTDCALVRIDRGTFDQLLKHDPEIAIRMLRKLSYRLRQAGPALIDGVAEAPVQQSVAQEKVELKPEGTAIGTPRLISRESGEEAPLTRSGTTTIGRFDSSTGVHPTIDLKPLDHHRSTSRRHAVIEERKGSYYIRDEVGAANGTFVNGVRLKPGVVVEIFSGDKIQFGLVKMLLSLD